MSILVTGVSLRGIRRENQDSFLIKPFENGDYLLAVADGMGGGISGKHISQLVINKLKKVEKPFSYPVFTLKRKVFEINEEVLDYLGGRKGGSTLICVYYRKEEEKLYYVNVGDSRLTVIRNGKIFFSTIDQNGYERRRLEGMLNPPQESRRFLTYGLGISDNSKIEELFEREEWNATGSIKLEKTDFFIISSDGFHDYIDESSIEMCLDEDDIEKTLNCLLTITEQVSRDNITVIIGKLTVH